MFTARRLIVLAALVAIPASGYAVDPTGTWVLASSSLTYAVSHPFHHVEATSRDARGKGSVTATSGKFLIAVTVKSFDSGDSNRDLHMLQVTRAGTNPMITVRVTGSGDFTAGVPKLLRIDALVSFAGCTTTYHDVPLDLSDGPDGTIHVTGKLPLTLTDFKLEAPSLLGIPIKNAIPVTLDLYWKRG
jgi:hypothetical protein